MMVPTDTDAARCMQQGMFMRRGTLRCVERMVVWVSFQVNHKASLVGLITCNCRVPRRLDAMPKVNCSAY